jgi:hypothetical protein
MKLSGEIDLGRSLRQVFGDSPGSEVQVQLDRDRQTRTAEAILDRFFTRNERQRRELVLLADEVGLGKTYVALAVAVSTLDLIRSGQTLEGLPSNKPAILVLTPNNDPLYNKWLREAEAFQRDCARHDGGLDWLRIEHPLEGSSKSGNIIDLTVAIRQASRSRPVLLIAKQGALGAALHHRDWWRRRALACLFEACGVKPADRPWLCRQVLGSGAQGFMPELLDLRKAAQLWEDTAGVSTDLHRAYHRALDADWLRTSLNRAVEEGNGARLADLIDDLTRLALTADWPLLPLVVIDEVHGLKNRHTQARRHLGNYLNGRACRLLGLSATPFQLRHDELLSVLELRQVTALTLDRASHLEEAVTRLAATMRAAQEEGELFRRRWRVLRARDRDSIHAAWGELSGLSNQGQAERIGRLRPPRVAHALEAALALEEQNRKLQAELCGFVIRHRHQRGYREHFVGHAATPGNGCGQPYFGWEPGLEVRGNAELGHYLMMRAVALAKEEKGLPGLGSELTGSYRHLILTSAVWKRLAGAKNPLLPKYGTLLEEMLPVPAADHDHCKIQATVRRAMHFFGQGQKTLIFCVFTKTAEALRDELQDAIQK